MTAAQGRAQLLLRQIHRDGPLDVARIETHANAIQAAITQMATQIGELQDIAFLQIGRPLDLNTAPGDIVEVARRAIERMTRVEGSTVTVELDVAHEPLIAAIDRVRIERVLDNLLSNAVKYTGQNKVIRIRIWEESKPEGRRIYLSVTDNGIGIPAKDMPRIFERFQRASNVSNVEGAGVGLSGARQIVRQHGGKISVSSVEGVGSTFTMWLPGWSPVEGTDPADQT